MDLEKHLTATLEESIRAKREFWEKSRGDFVKAAERLVRVIKEDRKILVFGNGGSACDALHFAGEWSNRYLRDRKPLPALALTADATLMSSISNDYAFSDVFERQVLALGRQGDVAIGISTSGNSDNVLKGLRAARKQGMTTLVLLGRDGGKILAETVADHVLLVPGTEVTPRIQECHEWILHSLCDYVDHKILGAG